MSLNKFGSHVLSKFGSGENNNDEIKIVTDAKLFYHISLPLFARYSPTEKKYISEFNKKSSLTFPLISGTILAGEWSKKDVTLLINDKSGKIEGRELKKGDLIEFSRKPSSSLNIFYGELIVKCPVVIE